ncbi:MAG: hypothetical protein QGI68_01480 [Pseudomonadales bacterium]|jgi:alkylation response protein AidB-like acyl-CoA dehydrogenase|nr:hypothetical protein [Pseudomonadales bacterium]MDP7360679.1 hypothetical protein [Pseudomonadales bacterium]MDP7594226.1 hypothetical protein [Pseudomonadales bacterium]HJN52929.1 hypothetical protein [Pseudomonadales bacterium]|tara:strand:- start:143 stop:1036 length:894 start_codon:yes stop_codon:yes gene_type:complete
MQEDTDFRKELERLESGALVAVAAPTEAAWYDIWMTEDVSGHAPLGIALVGGALADRPAWVFHAGYQGMMHYAFPFCPNQGWASYLVAEDKSGEFPPAAVTKSAGRLRLSGSKSWVAASDHVNHLVVQVKCPDEDIMVLVERDEPGVMLSSRDKPGFLADMSQGFASFEAVTIRDDRVFTSIDLPVNFAHSEPHHVLTALNAFMLSHTLSLGRDTHLVTATASSLRQAADLIDRDAVDDDFFLGIADLDAETTETARIFATFADSRDPELSLRWQKDRGLISMFSKGLQKRAKWLRG